MTNTEKIQALIRALELIELAIVSNDRQKQLEYARQLRELRESIA
jgi:hypothetical protein